VALRSCVKPSSRTQAERKFVINHKNEPGSPEFTGLIRSWKMTDRIADSTAAQRSRGREMQNGVIVYTTVRP